MRQRTRNQPNEVTVRAHLQKMTMTMDCSQMAFGDTIQWCTNFNEHAKTRRSTIDSILSQSKFISKIRLLRTPHNFPTKRILTPKVKESKCIIESIIHLILRSILLHSLKYHSQPPGTAQSSRSPRYVRSCCKPPKRSLASAPSTTIACPSPTHSSQFGAKSTPMTLRPRFWPRKACCTFRVFSVIFPAFVLIVSSFVAPVMSKST